MTRRPALLVDLDGTLTDNFVGIARSICRALVASPAAIAPALDAVRASAIQRSV